MRVMSDPQVHCGGLRPMVMLRAQQEARRFRPPHSTTQYSSMSMAVRHIRDKYFGRYFSMLQYLRLF